MKIVIFGAAGMLGHKLVQQLSEKYELVGIVKRDLKLFEKSWIPRSVTLYGNVDARDINAVELVLQKEKPSVVVNCVGIIKQLKQANDPIISININSLFPHQLAKICKELNCRLIHLSTDCVFSGLKGKYVETDTSDAQDLYGRSKYLGEVDEYKCITLRTSIIGRELDTSSGLIEWFLRNSNNVVNGYRGAIYTGFTTLEMSRIIERVINHSECISGVYHVSSNPINKYELLKLVRDAFRLDTKIMPVDQPMIDRSLVSTRFRDTFKYEPPSWENMINMLYADKI